MKPQRFIGTATKDRQARAADYFSREAVLERMQRRQRRKSPPITTDSRGQPTLLAR